MHVTPYYAAIFGLFFVFLRYRVIKVRRYLKIAIGDAKDEALCRAIRVHGNFSEYVPFTLMLIYFAEMKTHSHLSSHVLCLMFLVARLAHAYGVSQLNEDLRFRVFAMVTTACVIGISALLILAKAIWN